MQMSEFIAKLDGSDQNLADRLSKCKKPEEAYAIAQEYGVEGDILKVNRPF
ncbi:Nif11-like leader peptide family natural product precursor [Syntrophomonas palmitatica]|uniref:Nif11-like leader peptide family natural product precursor n=1 Tax=Syntrophomonas palmitatica TaxID=402877 RepID=UPI000AAAAF68|nr:Nif11-like leader peptide family natural product precursor [Syntrophomonas palmitatica]